ncbi:MAG: DUF4917 family protein [Dehalococcoidia bacterium]|nr:DUF4917 family protein [Dehalococcoidia bacterium]
MFTTNYDSFLYWAEMHGLDVLEGSPRWTSGSARNLMPVSRISRTRRRRRGSSASIRALHLYVANGEIRKQSWVRTGTRLTTLVRDGLAAGQYPVFVAEGDAEKKRDQITGNGYLSTCSASLNASKARLVLFKFVCEGDRHIGNTIADARDIWNVFVGIYEEEGTPEANAIVRACELMIQRREENIAARREYRIPLDVRY